MAATQETSVISGRDEMLKAVAAQDEQAHELGRQGKWAQAEPLFRDNVNTLLAVLGLDDEDDHVLRAKNNLAANLNHQDKHGEAEVLHREVYEIHQRLRGPAHPDTLTDMNNLAAAISHQDKQDEAIDLQRRALALCPQVWGAEDAATYDLKANLANMLHDRGDTHAADPSRSRPDWEESLQLHQDVLAARTSTLGEDHADTLRAMNGTASILAKVNRTDEAIDLYRRSLVPAQQSDLSRLIASSNLARVLQKQADYGEAEQLHRVAGQLAARQLGEHDEKTQASIQGLKDALRSQGKMAEAESVSFERLLTGSA